MIIAFDGNVFSGKTSIIEAFTSLYPSVHIKEQGSFIKVCISSHEISSKEMAIDLQIKYLAAEEERCVLIQDNKINLLDRSFVSMAAHVFALYKTQSVDIREWFLQEIRKRMESGSIIIPDEFYFVRCSYDVIFKRIVENTSKNTDPVYYTKKYLHAIEGFNNKWISRSGGSVVDTDTVLPIGLAQRVKSLIVTRGTARLNTQQVCDYLQDILLQ